MILRIALAYLALFIVAVIAALSLIPGESKSGSEGNMHRFLVWWRYRRARKMAEKRAASLALKLVLSGALSAGKKRGVVNDSGTSFSLSSGRVLLLMGRTGRC